MVSTTRRKTVGGRMTPDGKKSACTCVYREIYAIYVCEHTHVYRLDLYHMYVSIHTHTVQYKPVIVHTFIHLSFSEISPILI